MKRFFQKYVEFIRQPDVARLLLVALLARTPVGMAGFAMLMFLRESLGNYAQAGAAVGTQLLAIALAAPIQGRLIDRYGARTLLIVTGVVQPLAMLAVMFSALARMPYAFILACAVVAGMFSTPITTLTRTAWRHRFQSEDDRRTAFALDSVMIEINFTIGPAIIAVILATAGATAAFGTAIACVVGAIFIFLFSPALKYFKRGVAVERHMLGPLTEPRLLLVFTATFGLTVAFGLIEVGYPALATSLAAPALAGILLSVNSIGSAIGGAIFGGLHLNMRVERQLATTMGLMAIPLLLHALFLQPLVFGVVAFFAGLLIAPSIASQSVLVSRLAPAKYATEAFTWSSTFIVSGLGAGMALGGLLVETTGLRSAFATGALIVAAMSILALQITPAPAPQPAAAS
ncbi:MAG TPA: MFS transporter [Usitatibacter sp.]|nr:MFS transporter [Usitatibacter sp.]